MTTTIEATPTAGLLVPLADGSLACEACGVIVAGAEPVVVVPWIAEGDSRFPGSEHYTRVGADRAYGRCPSCAAIHDRAEHYVAEHQAWAASVGRYIATERVVSALTALAILGRDIADSDLGLMLPRLWPPAHQLHFASSLSSRPAGMAASEPWSHVTPAERTSLRQAYALGLRDRVALHQPPVPIPCPSRACLMCGVGSVSRSAIEVARRGGIPATTAAVWRRVEGRGHLCPACAEAVDDSGGAIGASATARAALAYAKVQGVDLGTGGFAGLRRRIEDDEVRVPTWEQAGGGRVSPFPFAHAAALLGI